MIDINLADWEVRLGPVDVCDLVSSLDGMAIASQWRRKE